MPLRCVDDVGHNYLVWRISADEWSELREQNRQRRHLRMPCCGAQVVLRKSPLGTRHFAHARKGPCATAPETAEHLRTKMEIAEAVERAGWTAQTECRGQTPEGAEWVADVMATKGRARIAFEVQWSKQDKAETEARQERYKRSGVRCLWLMRDPPGRPTLELPMLRLHIAAPEYLPQVVVPGNKELQNPYSPRWPHQTIRVFEFVEGALCRNFRYAPLLGQRVPLVLYGRYRKCTECDTWHRAITEMVLHTEKVIPGYPLLNADLLDIYSGTHIDKAIQDALPLPLRRKWKLGNFEYDEGPGGAFVLAQACFKCSNLLRMAFHSPDDEEIGQVFIQLPALRDLNPATVELEPWEYDLKQWWWL